jgi:hypothetical protein
MPPALGPRRGEETLVQDSLLSDELLHHLMAVGQVDVLVGIPTLDNAATVGGVVRAVHQAFARYFPRDRTVLINSDGGSVDGSPAIVRDGAVDDHDTVTVSHTLRTVHRISTPYHGVPGKGNALRQILAAADLTQARAVAVLDADVASVTPEWVAALIRPVREQQYDYVAPIYPRHPLDGPLVTQMVRPLIDAVYGWRIREPLAAEFGCSHAFVTHCLEQDVWAGPLARYGIDLWVTGAALTGGFRCCQAPLGTRRTGGHARLGFQELFQQVVGAAFGCVEAHAETWRARTAVEPLPVVGSPPAEADEAPAVDPGRLTQAFCTDIEELQPVLRSILSADTLDSLNALAHADCDQLRYPDDLWVRTVYEFLAAHHRGVMRREHITQALVPLYLGRTGSFLAQWAGRSPAEVDAALESLSLQFERSKPWIVEHWDQSAQAR